MKKSLYFILLTTFLAQMPSESMGMELKRQRDEISSGDERKDESPEEREAKRGKRESEENATSLAAELKEKNDSIASTTSTSTTTTTTTTTTTQPSASTKDAQEQTAEDKACGICGKDFGSSNEDGSTVTQLKLVCCEYPICEGCVNKCITEQNGICPGCRGKIGKIKELKDPLIQKLLKRKKLEKVARERKEQEEARERERKEQEEAIKQREVAQIQEQIRKFSTGEDITAYRDIPVDAKIEVTADYQNLLYNSSPKDIGKYYYRGLTIVMRLPILHFLAKGGPENHAEYQDALELVQYFVEEKHANINEKVDFFTAAIGTEIQTEMYGRHACSKDDLGQYIYNENVQLLTPLDVADIYGNESIAEYLRNKIAEQEAKEQEASTSPESQAEQQQQQSTSGSFLGRLFGSLISKKK
jgi:hypothetical protein